MSVIKYDRDEILDAMAASWTRGSAGSRDAISYMETLAEFANKVSEANSRAYAATYGEETGLEDLAGLTEPAITGAEIKRALIQKTGERYIRGLRCLRGLRYNLIANNGKDFATFEILDTLLDLFAGLQRMSLRGAE